MGRTGCADIRDGDLFHGRYRILHSIEDDRTGALYEAVDMVNNARRIVKVVRAETLVDAGIRVRFRSDAPLWDSENAAYISDAGIEHDTKSLFLIMDLAEDSELEPVTRQRVIRLGESGALREWSNSDCLPPRRALVPLPLPPPLPPSPSRASQVPLPPPAPVLPAGKSFAGDTNAAAIGSLPSPTPPPKRPLPEPTPSSGQRMFNSVHFFGFVAVAIGVGSLVYFRAGRTASEDLPETGDTIAKNSPEHLAPISYAPVAPNAAPVVTEIGSQEVPDASAPTNWIPGETMSTKSEKPAPDAASPKTPPNNSPPKSTTHDISKQEAAPPTAAPPITPASTKRQRESIF